MTIIFNTFILNNTVMKNLLFYITCLIALTSCITKPGSTSVVDSTTVYHVPDEKAINQTIKNTYAAISFKNGEQPRYVELRKHCLPTAQFINTEGDSTKTTSLNQFIYLYRTMVESQHIHYFYEHEIFGKTEQFGNVAQHLSTYKTYINTPDSLSETGVDFFTLIKTKDGWKISGVTWDVEKKGLKVPRYYLRK
jgi:hypothetical protein